MNTLLAAFYTPGIRAIEYLFQAGFCPEQIRLLTHDVERNRMLMSFAEAHGIETRTFPVKSPEALKWVQDFQPDVLFSLYFRDIIPKSIFSIPRFGAVNLHPSLLPKYRGTFSAPWVIINGEQQTGFTYHYMLEQVDAGNILLQHCVPVMPNDTAYALYHRLIVEAVTAFGEAFKLVVQEQHPGRLQTGEPTYYPRQVPFGGYINPSWRRDQVDRFIRAMYFPPHKGALVKLTGGGGSRRYGRSPSTTLSAPVDRSHHASQSAETSSFRPPNASRNLVILGAGGFAREVAWLVSDINRTEPDTWNLIGFWEHDESRLGQFINGVPVIGVRDVKQLLPDLYAVAAIGDPRIKRRAVQEAEALGCCFTTLVHPTVQYDRQTVSVGPGSIICAGNILTVNIIIGMHVIINLDCTIGHDSVIEDFVTISPGCHLSGYTTVREGAYLGTGAVTLERHEIGAQAIIGAGAVVVRDIPPNVTAVGVPAKVREG